MTCDLMNWLMARSVSLALSLTLGFNLACIAHGNADDVRSKDDPAQTKRIEEWINQLNDVDFVVRSRAERHLVEVDEGIDSRLQELLESAGLELEMRRRLERILEGRVQMRKAKCADRKPELAGTWILRECDVDDDTSGFHPQAGTTPAGSFLLLAFLVKHGKRDGPPLDMRLSFESDSLSCELVDEENGKVVADKLAKFDWRVHGTQKPWLLDLKVTQVLRGGTYVRVAKTRVIHAICTFDGTDLEIVFRYEGEGGEADRPTQLKADKENKICRLLFQKVDAEKERGKPKGKCPPEK